MSHYVRDKSLGWRHAPGASVTDDRRLTIRPAVYRGEDGFALTGDGMSVFDTDRVILEAIRQVYRQIGDKVLAGKASSLIHLRKVPPDEWWAAYLLVVADDLDCLADKLPHGSVAHTLTKASAELRAKHKKSVVCGGF